MREAKYNIYFLVVCAVKTIFSSVCTEKWSTDGLYIYTHTHTLFTRLSSKIRSWKKVLALTNSYSNFDSEALCLPPPASRIFHLKKGTDMQTMLKLQQRPQLLRTFVAVSTNEIVRLSIHWHIVPLRPVPICGPMSQK